VTRAHVPRQVKAVRAGSRAAAELASRPSLSRGAVLGYINGDWVKGAEYEAVIQRVKEAWLGLGRIPALHSRAFTAYQIREHIRCLCCLSDNAAGPPGAAARARLLRPRRAARRGAAATAAGSAAAGSAPRDRSACRCGVLVPWRAVQSEVCAGRGRGRG
jgi:hypothetical protein